MVVGAGRRKVSLIAGNHADEPVGAETLWRLAEFLASASPQAQTLTDQFTFVIVPQVNPDGEAVNRPWVDEWPNPLAYVQHAVREPPGRDVEFGYPDMRPENEAVAQFLRNHGPFDLHMSLHSMAVADGGLLLIERHWVDRTVQLRRQYAEALSDANLRLFDHDRKGEKGFRYIEPGFNTTPEGTAMRQHFTSLGDPATAALFHQSSMEYVRSLGGDPLCLVTELPLFVLTGQVGQPQPGVPTTYLKFRELLPQLRLKVERGDPLDAIVELVAPFGLQPLALDTAVRLQLRALELGLATIASESDWGA